MGILDRKQHGDDGPAGTRDRLMVKKQHNKDGSEKSYVTSEIGGTLLETGKRRCGDCKCSDPRACLYRARQSGAASPDDRRLRRGRACRRNRRANGN